MHLAFRKYWKQIIGMAISAAMSVISYGVYLTTVLLCMNPRQHHPLAHPAAHFLLNLGFMAFWGFYIGLHKKQPHDPDDRLNCYLLIVIVGFVMLPLMVCLYVAGADIKNSMAEGQLIVAAKFLQIFDAPFHLVETAWKTILMAIL